MQDLQIHPVKFYLLPVTMYKSSVGPCCRPFPGKMVSEEL